MIILTNSPARKLQVVLGAASVTAAPRVYAAWVDHTTTTYTPDAATVASNGTTQTDVVAAPGASTQRQIKSVSCRNIDTIAHTITFLLDDAGTDAQLFSAVVPVGYSAEYTDGRGWAVRSTTGAEVVLTPEVSPLNGFPAEFHKVGTAAEAVGNWYCYAKDTGFPGAWAPGAPGLAGRTTDGTAAPDAGCIPIPNPSSGGNYLTSFQAALSVVQYLAIFDFLWVNSGIVVTTTTAQTINSVAWPARDVDGSTNGRGVRVGLLVTTATTNAGATAPTISYTNSAGTAGRTGTMTFPATAVVGTIVWFNLQAGDEGVRSVQSITLVTSLVTGAVSLVATRRIASVPATIVNTVFAALLGRGVRLYNGVCLMLCHRAAATTATTIEGTLAIETR